MDPRNTDRLNQKRTDPVERYREYVDFQLSVDGEGVGLREARQTLADSGLADRVMDLDVVVAASLQELDYVNPLLLSDAPNEPLSKWWWHLGKIRAGSYPAELLSPHLRAVYAEFPKAA